MFGVHQSVFAKQIDDYNFDKDNIVIKKSNGTMEIVPVLSGKDVGQTVKWYLSQSNITWAQPNYIYESQVAPNDEFYQEYQVNYLQALNFPKAWDITQGSEDVVVAVIDAGVDMDHPDLIGNIWFNKKETPLNGIDDDNNGYVDDFNGWDFLRNTSDPHPKLGDGFTSAGANHGTIIAGVIAATTNNSDGVAGACWKCKIMPLRALASNAQGTTDNLAEAIDYAVNNGADIISMSFVTSAPDKIFSEAIARAHRAGVLLVAAVGNDGLSSSLIGGDLDFRPLYPVCFDNVDGANDILGVASVDLNRKKSSFSNYGFNCVDVATVGVGIFSTKLFDPKFGDRYDEFNFDYIGGQSGTSFAVPSAAGAAALVKSVNPALSNDQIIDIIRKSAINVDSLNPFYAGQLGAGILDAEAAVKMAQNTQGNIQNSSNKGNILASSGSGHKVNILSLDVQGNQSLDFLAYPEFFRGGAEVASGDVDGDGQIEIITGAGAGGGPQVRIFSATGVVEGQFFAYNSGFRGGVHIAVTDINKDGIDEIITSAGAGFSSEVKIFDNKGNVLGSFDVTAQGLDGGVTVSAGDIDSDGEIEIVTGTGGGSLPLVQIFDKLGNKEKQFLAYPEFFRGGVNVALGDVDADGQIEIVTSAGFGGGPQVRIFSATGQVKGQFFAFESGFRGGANVAVADIDSDGKVEIIAGSGQGRESEIRTFQKTGVQYLQETVFSVFEDGYEGGVFVGI